jgi:hypothetical protein
VRDGKRQVSVRRTVTAYRAAQDRQTVVEVRVVHGAHDTGTRSSEFEDDEPSILRQYTVNFPQAAVEIREISRAEGDNSAVYASIREW